MMMTRQTHPCIIKIPRVCGYYCKISLLYVFSAPASVLNCTYYIFNEIIKFWKCKEPNHIYIEKKKIIIHLIHFTVWNTLYCTSFLWMRKIEITLVITFLDNFQNHGGIIVFYIKSYYGVVFSWNGKTQLSSSI